MRQSSKWRVPSEDRAVSGFVGTLQRQIAAHRLGPSIRARWGTTCAQPSGPLIPALPEPVGATPWITVVFDLDETLCNNRRLFKPILRPGVSEMLESLRAERDRWEAQQRGEASDTDRRACYIEIVLWTASMECAARPVLRLMDPAGRFFDHCVFRDSRWWSETAPCIKNLRRLGRELSRVIIVENSPVSVSHNRSQAVLVRDFVGVGSAKDQTLTHVGQIIRDWAAAVAKAPNGAPLPEGVSAATFLAAHPLMNPKTNELASVREEGATRRVLLMPVGGSSAVRRSGSRTVPSGGFRSFLRS